MRRTSLPEYHSLSAQWYVTRVPFDKTGTPRVAARFDTSSCTWSLNALVLADTSFVSVDLAREKSLNLSGVFRIRDDERRSANRPYTCSARCCVRCSCLLVSLSSSVHSWCLSLCPTTLPDPIIPSSFFFFFFFFFFCCFWWEGVLMTQLSIDLLFVRLLLPWKTKEYWSWKKTWRCDTCPYRSGRTNGRMDA